MDYSARASLLYDNTEISVIAKMAMAASGRLKIRGITNWYVSQMIFNGSSHYESIYDDYGHEIDEILIRYSEIVWC